MTLDWQNIAHPMTLGVAISRSVVLALPVVLLGIWYAVKRSEAMHGAGVVRRYFQRVGDACGTISWE